MNCRAKAKHPKRFTRTSAADGRTRLILLTSLFSSAMRSVSEHNNTWLPVAAESTWWRLKHPVLSSLSEKIPPKAKVWVERFLHTRCGYASVLDTTKLQQASPFPQCPWLWAAMDCVQNIRPPWCSSCVVTHLPPGDSYTSLLSCWCYNNQNTWKSSASSLISSAFFFFLALCLCCVSDTSSQPKTLGQNVCL